MVSARRYSDYFPKQSIDASLNWRQTGQNYKINLFGPLGIGAVELTGVPGKFTLENSKGQKQTANSAEILMQEELGWSLPVSNLYYWVRGIPAPGSHYQAKFDEYNHIIELKQQGWDIRYLRYTGVDGKDMPSKIFMHIKDLQAKLIISQWQL